MHNILRYISYGKENLMITNRIYDPTVEKLASTFPHLDVSDAIGARNTLNKFLEAMAAEGVKRPTDDRVEEIERTIPGPDGAPDVPIRIYMPNEKNTGQVSE
jgi:hypothetical protein